MRFYLFLGLVILSGSCQTIATKQQQSKTAPNVIFMVGDGMGLAQISLAIENAQDNLSFANCKHVGFIKTSSIDDYITDSAAGATAFSTGKKTKNAYVGVDERGKSLPTLFEIAERKNWLTALVVTSSITHATPACFYAHQNSRYNSLGIAQDFLSSGVDYAIGAGKPYFDSLDNFKVPYAVGLSNFSKMEEERWIGFYNQDSNSCAKMEDGRGDFLPKSTEMVLNKLEARKKPFFMLIEGSQIDWGGHDNDAKYVSDELLDFDKTIKIVLAYLKEHPNTLVVVTADHETGGLSLLDDGNDNMVPHFSSEHHSGIMVPVFAFGKGAEDFTGIYENTEIFEKLKKLMLLD